MQQHPAMLTAIWTVSTIEALAAMLGLFVVLRRGFALQYPALTTLLTASALRTSLLIYAHLTKVAMVTYVAIWEQAQFVLNLLYVAVTFEVFVHLCRHFRKIGSFGTFLAIVMAAISAVTARWAGVIENRQWRHVATGLVRFERDESLACLIFLMLATAFFWQFDFQRI